MKKIFKCLAIILPLILMFLLVFYVVFLLLGLIVSNSNDYCEGEIINKEFFEERYEQQPVVLTIFNGTTVVPMTIIQNYYYPDRWRLTVQWYENESFHKRQIYVTEECYEAVNIGDWFVYDKNFCSYEEPCEKSPAQ